jgi:hypothetical protein
VAVKTMTQLPRAMLIDMDDTILSAYGRPDIAWNKVAAEFAGEFGPILPKQVAAAVMEYARGFWATADAEWRLKLEESGADLPPLPHRAISRCHRTLRSDSPIAFTPIARRKCSSFPARMMRSIP